MHVPRLLLAILLTGCLNAGTIQGVVLDHASGRPLSRTVVRLDPVPVAGRASPPPVLTRTARAGQFVFFGIPPGMYLLTALRNAYFPAGHGQRRPDGRGMPISVTTDSSLFAELRMRHKGAVTGRVLDENGVAAPGVPVVVYTARLPLRSVAGATSDDRGIFRASGLAPGKYWVRSARHILEDGSGWGPTFAPQSQDLKNAKRFPVAVDTDTSDADIHPEPGPLFSVSGWITCENAGEVLVTLSSETGQYNARTTCTNSPGAYQFEGLTPGAYEIFAEAQDGGASAFSDFILGGVTKVDLSLAKPPPVSVEVRRAGHSAPLDIPVRLMGRRQNLSETGTPVQIPIPRTSLAPGYWEFRATVPGGYYVQSIVNAGGSRSGRRNIERPPDWYEVYIDQQRPGIVRITVSDQGARIAGNTTAEGKPVPGAPVFLWPVGEDARRSLGGALEQIADTDGAFLFDNLPPGDYRLIASFDISEIDAELIELGRSPLVHCEPSGQAKIELPLWLAP